MFIKRNKFNVRIDAAGKKAREFDGHKFDSLAELARYKDLKVLIKRKEIHGLAVHVKFPLVGGWKDKPSIVTNYEADFVYFISKTGKMVVEDVKGHITSIYRLKKKWLKMQDGIEIVEIIKKKRVKNV